MTDWIQPIVIRCSRQTRINSAPVSKSPSRNSIIHVSQRPQSQPSGHCPSSIPHDHKIVKTFSAAFRQSASESALLPNQTQRRDSAASLDLSDPERIIESLETYPEDERQTTTIPEETRQFINR